MSQRIAGAAWCVILAGLVSFFVPAAPAEENHPDPIRIGMSSSIFVDVPPLLVQLVAPSFNALTKECTGLNGQMVVGGDPHELCRRLYANEVQLACFQGIEYAWIHQKYGDVEPLMVALYKHHYLKANLVVRKDSDINTFNDLRGKDLAYPRKTKEHCRLFLDRNCNDCGQCEPKEFFGQIARTMSMEGSLDDVCAGRVHATVVDAVMLEQYAHIKPGCAARLKVAKVSETFPAAVICCKKGVLSDATVSRFRSGMMSAHKADRTRELMGLYMITTFEPVPADYMQYCADILKTYPAPEPTSVKAPVQ